MRSIAYQSRGAQISQLPGTYHRTEAAPYGSTVSVVVQPLRSVFARAREVKAARARIDLIEDILLMKEYFKLSISKRVCE